MPTPPYTGGVLAGAEPIDLPGGPIGALLCHGFTGTTQSMRPWAEHLAAAGLTVSAPRLPGHGTRWQDLNKTRFSDWYGELERSFDDLRARCGSVFVMGLSMGGTLSLRLAEQRPDQVAGLVLVNASIASQDRRMKALPVLKHVLASLPGIASDIKKPGVEELAYDKVPLKALASLRSAWDTVHAELGRISCPVLIYRSADDHVVEPLSARLLLEGIRSPIEERVLQDSFHVATLDNDAPAIFDGSLEFVRAHSTAAAG